MTLLDYCQTDAQRRNVEAVDELGSFSAAAKAIGIGRKTVSRSYRLVESRAAREGWVKDPEMQMDGGTVPPGFVLDKTTVHTKDGGQVQRWDRVSWSKHEAARASQEAIEAAVEGIKPRPKVKAPATFEKGLLTQYTLTDMHVGMYAWLAETGGDWSQKEAERVLWKAFSEMLDRSPDSEVGLLAQLGDFLHFDGLLAVTPAHHNVLDTDTRYDKLVGLVLDMTVWMIDLMLEKHKKVHVIMAEGNHDESGSSWLRQFCRKYYAKNPRVTVDASPKPYYAILHGDILLGYHHGHKTKDAKLRDVFCSDEAFRAMWGKAKYAWIHTGHLHSSAIVETGGCILQRHPTLSARDAYSARGGWQSWRSAEAITYHKKLGKVSSVTVVP